MRSRKLGRFIRRKFNDLIERLLILVIKRFAKYLLVSPSPQSSQARGMYRKGELAKYIRYEVKGKARELFCMMSDVLPEPSKANIKRKIAHNLIDIRDHLLSRNLQPEDDKLLRGLFNFTIIVIDFDRRWGELFLRLIKLIKIYDWSVDDGWDEPRYQWFLEQKDAPPDATLIDMIRQERTYALQRRDGLAAGRIKVMQNVAEGLSEGKEINDVLFVLKDGKWLERGKK